MTDISDSVPASDTKEDDLGREAREAALRREAIETELKSQERYDQLKQLAQSNRTFLYTGMVFIFFALGLFAVMGMMLYQISSRGVDIGVPSLGDNISTDMTIRDIYNFYGRILSVFMAPLLTLIAASICVYVGIKLLTAAGAVSAQVIPPKEYELLAPLIREGDDEAISQYIRLSSLSGMTGTFTKVGLTGLPLATIILTIVLAILGIFNPQFFDLAQLTLGAFLGSYVQKRSEENERQIPAISPSAAPPSPAPQSKE